jgi:phosphoribosylanthranilate isomerase
VRSPESPVARLWIKICGMCTATDVEAAAAAGADAVGFVFYEPSPRNLTAASARPLQAAVPGGVERVAVFLHPSQSLIDEVLDAIRPDWVQTDVDDLDRLTLPAGQRVLPVLRINVGQKIDSEPFFPAPMRAKCGSEPNFRVMLEGGRSGRGERADWAEARALAARCQLVLAGGLDAGNVAEAVQTVRPFGIDVSSGVESARGVKDPARIREFIRAARAAESATAAEAGR